MQWSGWIGLALGFLAASTDFGPPPVVLDLGPVVPTPAPTPRHADRKRLISTITVQNSIKGETVVSFEAMDVAQESKERSPMIAARTYAISEAKESENPEAKKLANDIVGHIRELEKEMLRFAEVMGPPKEREPLVK